MSSCKHENGTGMYNDYCVDCGQSVTNDNLRIARAKIKEAIKLLENRVKLKRGENLKLGMIRAIEILRSE